MEKARVETWAFSLMELLRGGKERLVFLGLVGADTGLLALGRRLVVVVDGLLGLAAAQRRAEIQRATAHLAAHQGLIVIDFGIACAGGTPLEGLLDGAARIGP